MKKIISILTLFIPIVLGAYEVKEPFLWDASMDSVGRIVTGSARIVGVLVRFWRRKFFLGMALGYKGKRTWGFLWADGQSLSKHLGENDFWRTRP